MDFKKYSSISTLICSGLILKVKPHDHRCRLKWRHDGKMRTKLFLYHSGQVSFLDLLRNKNLWYLNYSHWFNNSHGLWWLDLHLIHITLSQHKCIFCKTHTQAWGPGWTGWFSTNRMTPLEQTSTTVSHRQTATSLFKVIILWKFTLISQLCSAGLFPLLQALLGLSRRCRLN